MHCMTLTLPLPPSPNHRPGHPMAVHRAKNEYREACWAAAIQCAMPRAEADLPKHITLSAVFYLRGRRDEDNLAASLKWLQDCLKCRQTGSTHWRRGLYDEKGYFIDDDPDHLTLASPRQVIDRKHPRLEVTLT